MKITDNRIKSKTPTLPFFTIGSEGNCDHVYFNFKSSTTVISVDLSTGECERYDDLEDLIENMQHNDEQIVNVEVVIT